MNILLIIIGIILIITNIRGIKKDKKNIASVNANGFKDKLESKDKSLSEYDVKLAMFQNKINKEIMLIKDDVEDLRMKIKDEMLISQNSKNTQYEKTNVIKQNNINHKIKNDNIDKVNQLIKQNYSIEEIANKLNISKGEVLLIKDLYLK